MQILKKFVSVCTPIMAVTAFMLSILNTPILMNFYFEPDLIVRGGGSNPTSEVLVGTFEISNEGRAVAKNVEIGITVQKDQRVSLLPKIDAEIIEEKEPHFVKSVRIKISNLAAGEHIILLALPGASNKALHPEVAQFMVESGAMEIPFINYIKSDSGLGKNETKSVQPPNMDSPKT
ncbi:TPA: hypothetical protein ACPVXQ_004618 [Vibrio parahaemolyticus]|uniref:hypothetical protein n=1 Tax=Vibrio parahaemolyticus TaxID=670 RepID=UPI0003DDE8D4|nr:hypothetical protein [Vibrio parahaemolyticus]ETJ84970.1 hypothetical protein D041_4904 [Vibrio parahaemolyticus EKP-008]TOE58818.1 hypothetical protein CGJ39_23150 [Vibrio parahaemolyticus]HCE3689762.1 hypothetical protein [Vibrio parahaemolyticus]HCG7163316.1 hypothetical protein [Vibrio parahaemolyticus]HCH2420968.1 hypothetical protein [Vibrio parahaemolyticus]